MKTIVIQAIWRLLLVSAMLTFSTVAGADDIWLRDWKIKAGHGNVQMQYKVAQYYMQRGIFRQGFDWYVRAAENGHPKAQYELAEMFIEGKYTPRNLDSAAYWYRKSAENGYEVAQEKLGKMFLNGGMVEKDPVQAYRWLRLAVTNGNLEAAEELNELENRMTREQVDKAEALLAGDKYSVR